MTAVEETVDPLIFWSRRSNVVLLKLPRLANDSDIPGVNDGQRLEP
ncbi:MAG TPA: hypothetical protein VK548_08910 [Candidatus Acidoferrum sp.]|nr:hypothetical protein [Candidatus Acidoferrum sp.]